MLVRNFTHLLLEINNEKIIFSLFTSGFLLFSTILYAAVPLMHHSKGFIVVFENVEANVTLQQPTFHTLAEQGAYIHNFHAITHHRNQIILR